MKGRFPLREPAFSFFKGHPGILPGSAPVPSGLVPMPASPRTADSRPARPPNARGIPWPARRAKNIFPQDFPGAEDRQCHRRLPRPQQGRGGIPAWCSCIARTTCPGKADTAGEREDEQAPGDERQPGPCLPQTHQRNAPVLQVTGHAHPHPALPAVTVYQTVQSGAGALPCPASGLYFFHVFLAGNMLPVFLPAPARTGLLPRIPSHQGPSFPAVLFFIPCGHEKGAA